MNTLLYYLTDMARAMLCLAPLWALGRWLFLRRTGGRTTPGREVLLALFALYLAALAQQTVLPRLVWDGEGLALMGWGGGGANYIPFATIRRYLRLGLTSAVSAVNLVGNVAVFVPLGLLPPLLWPRMGRGWAVLLGFGCSFFIELVQPLVGRQRDIDDLILNTLGALLGWLFSLALKRPRPKKETEHE